MKSSVPHPYRIRRLVCSLVLFVGFAALGQNSPAPNKSKEKELFSIVTVPEAITQGQSGFVQRVSKNPYAKAIHTISVGSLPSLQKNGKVQFSLPGHPNRLTATTTRISTHPNKDYEWYARLGSDADSGLVGDVVLFFKEGKAYGQIDVEDQVYEIRSGAGGLTTLTEIDPAKLKGSECQMNHRPGTSYGGQPKAERRSSSASGREIACPNNLVVLVLVTPRARAANADINQTVLTAVGQYNNAVFESGVNGTATITPVIRDFNFAETLFPINANEPPIVTDRERIINDNAVWQLRQDPAIQADMVVLITNGDYGNTSGAVGIAGAVDVFRNTPIPLAPLARAYAVVEQANAATTFTFAHELGHLFGGAHENDDIFPVPYAHGKKFERRNWLGIIRARYSTLMHTRTDNYSRIARFSNPDRSYDGVSTGTAGWENVARRISETAPDVRNFFPAARNFTAFIEGNSALYPGLNDFSALTQCGQGPYSYQWAVSVDGFNYLPAGTGETISLYYQPGGTPPSFLRLQATGSNGQQSTAFANLYVESGDPSFPARVNFENKRLQQFSLGDAAPNPFAQSTSIRFHLPAPQRATLVVTDVLGRTVAVLANGTLPAGHHSREFAASSLPAGLYHYTLTCEGFRQSKRMIHLK